MDEDDERSPYPGETAAPVQGPAPEARPPPRPPEGGDAVLEAFNQDVRTWLEIDGSIRSLQERIRERREAKRCLTERILAFMGRHNIEDLDTRGGRLRFQVSYVRAPLSQQAVRERIDSYCSRSIRSAQRVAADSSGEATASAFAFELHDALLGDRGCIRSERLQLRRI